MKRINPVVILLLLACLLLVTAPCPAREELIIVGSSPIKHYRKPAIFVPSTGQLFVRADTTAEVCNHTFFFYNSEYREFITACLDSRSGTRIISDPVDAKNYRDKTAKKRVMSPSEETRLDDFILWFADWDSARQQICLVGKHYAMDAPLRLLCYRRNQLGKGFTRLLDENINDAFFLIQNLMLYQGKAVIAGRKSKRDTHRYELVYDIANQHRVSYGKVEYGRLLGKLNSEQLAVYKKGHIYGYDLQQMTPFTEVPNFPFQRVYGQIPGKKAYFANSDGLKMLDMSGEIYKVEMFHTQYVYGTTGFDRRHKFTPSSGTYVALNKLDLTQICEDIATRWCAYRERDRAWTKRGHSGMVTEYCLKYQGMCLSMEPSATFETDFVKVYGGKEGRLREAPP
ncbi:MAG: hypothetical protein OEZ39_17980 [Gammaproteobacteria bacterium]|nr:hypothetical protein [Gammaproteobacteria bacterium]MDH5653756.1 hypothetical protein [Gammaproteobacteria bacterium]